MTDDELLQHVVPAGLLEDRQVAKVVLQPSSLWLENRINRFSLFAAEADLHFLVTNMVSYLSCRLQNRAQESQCPAGSPKPDDEPGEDLQQQDVTQMKPEEERPGLKQALFLCMCA